jgi:hypothetical protein
LPGSGRFAEKAVATVAQVDVGSASADNGSMDSDEFGIVLRSDLKSGFDVIDPR